MSIWMLKSPIIISGVILDIVTVNKVIIFFRYKGSNLDLYMQPGMVAGDTVEWQSVLRRCSERSQYSDFETAVRINLDSFPACKCGG